MAFWEGEAIQVVGRTELHGGRQLRHSSDYIQNERRVVLTGWHAADEVRAVRRQQLSEVAVHRVEQHVPQHQASKASSDTQLGARKTVVHGLPRVKRILLHRSWGALRCPCEQGQAQEACHLSCQLSKKHTWQKRHITARSRSGNDERLGKSLGILLLRCSFSTLDSARHLSCTLLQCL